MGTRIALVDDDQNILTSVSLTLESEGFEVDCYHDGETALRGLGRRPVELVVLDIKMPRMDGMELLQKIRAGSSLPVIFLTSKDDELDEALGLGMGADDYITKPFSQRLLIARIRAVLRRASEDEMDQAAPNIVRQGDLLMDPDRHLCSWKGEEVKQRKEEKTPSWRWRRSSCRTSAARPSLRTRTSFISWTTRARCSRRCRARRRRRRRLLSFK